MRFRLLLLIALATLAAAPAFACGAQYTLEQCRQMDNQNDGSTGDGSGGGGAPPTCPYYMCGNAVPGHQSAVDWCEATQTWTDCPIEFCSYQPCSGFNCYPSWQVCLNCSSRTSNKVSINQCPRQ